MSTRNSVKCPLGNYCNKGGSHIPGSQVYNEHQREAMNKGRNSVSPQQGSMDATDDFQPGDELSIHERLEEDQVKDLYEDSILEFFDDVDGEFFEIEYDGETMSVEDFADEYSTEISSQQLEENQMPKFSINSRSIASPVYDSDEASARDSANRATLRKMLESEPELRGKFQLDSSKMSFSLGFNTLDEARRFLESDAGKEMIGAPEIIRDYGVIDNNAYNEIIEKREEK